jgi:diacylglycerol kinase (ATP)
MKPEIHGGVKAFFSRRIIATLRNTWSGLYHSFWYEEAFRVELLLSLVLIPTAFWLATDYLQLIALLGCLFLVLIVELLNTGIEATVDRVGPEFHDLSKHAKDAGSAAVGLSLLLCILVWAIIVMENMARF